MNHLAAELAVKLQAQYSIFYAPVIAENAEVASDLKKSYLVDSALKAAKNVDAAFIGAGNDVQESTWHKMNYITSKETQELKSAGAVGDIVSDFFDENCQTVKMDFSSHLIAVKQRFYTNNLICVSVELDSSYLFKEALLNSPEKHPGLSMKV